MFLEEQKKKEWNDERKKIMGFTVQDMLDMKLFQKANLLWGKGGIGQEIRGVTII